MSTRTQAFRVPGSPVVFVVLRRVGDLVRTRHVAGPREGQRVTHTAAFVGICERVARANGGH